MVIDPNRDTLRLDVDFWTADASVGLDCSTRLTTLCPGLLADANVRAVDLKEAALHFRKGMWRSINRQLHAQLDAASPARVAEYLKVRSAAVAT